MPNPRIIGIKLNGLDYDYEDEPLSLTVEENTEAIGNLNLLETTVKTDLVSAINEVNSGSSAVGDLENLTTEAKNNIVSAINEVDGHADDNAEAIGTLANLTTTVKTDLVSAINEVDGHADDNAEAIGNLANLETTVKTDLVSALNEVNEDVSDIGDLANLTTTAKTDLVSAINEVDGHADDNADAIGTLANLTTTAKTDLVSAINEVNAKQPEVTFTDLTSFFTYKTGTGVVASTIIGKVLVSPSITSFNMTVDADYTNSVGTQVTFRMTAPRSVSFYNALKQIFGSKLENASTGQFIRQAVSAMIHTFSPMAEEIVFGSAYLYIGKLSATEAIGTIEFDGSVGICINAGHQDSTLELTQSTVVYQL